MKLCPDCLQRYPSDQVRCAIAQHPRLLEVSDFDDPRTSQLIDGRYLVLDRLGEGAMGVVYRAWQRSTAREVALKILPVDAALIANPHEHAEMRARFRREVQLAARIDSAFVARVHDSGDLPDGGLYFAMELVSGTPLDKVLLTDGRLEPARVLRLANQLGQALSVVHGLGLVHRDVKPGNLMVVKNAQGREALKIVDFGIARAFEVDLQMGKAAMTNLTMAGALIGSFAYMAPEQFAPAILGKPRNIGPWTDVYAAGVAIYELLTGQHPYPGPTPPAFGFQHQTAPIPSATKTLGAGAEDLALAGLDKIIARALAKSPTERYTDGTAFAAAIIELERKISAASTDKVGPDGKVVKKSRDATEEVEVVYGPDDTHPDQDPLTPVAPVDPGALRGISTDDIRARASSTIEVGRPRRLTKSRVAFALAVALALTTVIWDLVGTLPR